MRLKNFIGFLTCVLLAACSTGQGKSGLTVSSNHDVQTVTIPGTIVLYVREGEQAIIDVDASSVLWFINSPLPLDYDNSDCTGHYCVQEIRYETIELKALSERKTILLPDVPQLRSLGTHELVLKADGKTTDVQVVVRRDDSYVGYLTEMIGVPFVYGPRSTPQGHQADLRKGADCVALIIYGKRRQGHAVPYVAPPRLYDFTRTIGNSSSLDDVEIVEGDILHFGFQTAVISRDNPPVGMLSDNDIIIQTYHELVEEKPLGELPYRHMDFDILRWMM